jgi:hypothetical protein
MKKLIFLITVTLFLTGCLWDDNDEVVEKVATISQSPTNLGALNTEYDDYNSNYNPGEEGQIIFSSNRNSQGKDFDLVYKSLYFIEDAASGNLTFEVKDYDIPFDFKIALRNINSEKNEFGPYFKATGGNLIFMYSTGNSSGYDIQFVDMTGWYYGQWENFDSIPKSIPKINEYADDLYPTLSTDKRNLIFCSNKDGQVFNIYDASFNSEITSEALISGNIQSIKKIETISSAANDKCPFIGENNMMVFASDREGGFGGYDLWYSFYVNGEWAVPKNFGSKINSDKDEFRPIIFNVLGHNLMIFSSNRPGGTGGFDLYAVEYETL